MEESLLKKKFGERIRDLRSSFELSQEQLAEQAALSVEYISKIERGLASPSFEVLAKLSQVFAVEPVELFNFHNLEK